MVGLGIVGYYAEGLEFLQVHRGRQGAKDNNRDFTEGFDTLHRMQQVRTGMQRAATRA
jgi:hypothetical protein